MTKDLNRIAELKLAIDSLYVTKRALYTLYKEGILTYDQTLDEEIEQAKKKLAELKKEKD